MSTRHHWANNLHDAGCQPRRMKFPQELTGYVFKTKASHLDGGHRLWSGTERDGLCHATLPKTHHMKMTTASQSIPAWLSPETWTTPSVAGHEDGCEKYATDRPKSLCARNNITIGTWNVRSLRAAGKVEELAHEMKRHRWNILGLCEVRWKNFGETSTPEGHKLFFHGREDRHKHGVGFLIHKDTVNAMGCRPVYSRFIAICLKASPFNITIIQAYAPTTDYDDGDIEDFYDQLQEVIDQTPKKDILVVHGDWNAKIGEDANKNWRETCGQNCNPETNERGLRLIEFTSYNNLKVVNTSGAHKPSRHWTWHSPGGDYHNQINYIMAKWCFQLSVNIAKTRSFPGANIGSDHELAMMTFKFCLQRVKNQGSTRIRFSLEKLKDPNIAEIFWAMIGGKFAPLLALENQDTEKDALIYSFNTAVTETANNILCKHWPEKKPWVTDNILKLWDKRRELKQNKNMTEGAKPYREANQQVKKSMRKAKETWIEKQCQGYRRKPAEKQQQESLPSCERTDKLKTRENYYHPGQSMKCLTEEQDILKRWTEYCSKLYTHTTTGDPKVLDVPPPINNDSYPILREEVEAAVVDSIPSELV